MLALSLVVLAGLAAPFALPLERVRPSTAAALWFVSLLLRGAAAAFAAIFVVLYIPTTQLFSLLTHWCWHAVIPFLATHLGLSGHQLGDAAIIAPAFFLTISAASVSIGLWRAARQVQKLLARSAVGNGPGASLVVGGDDVLVAAAGLRRPKVVISAGALTVMDDEELAASLDHEHGHIERGHRWIVAAASLCRAVARLVPGTQVAYRELLLQLERDADRWALDRRHDPAALASAICKAAESRVIAPASMALGGFGGLTRRIEELIEGPARVSRRIDATVRIVTAVVAALTLASLAAIPSVADAGMRQASAPAQAHECPH